MIKWFYMVDEWTFLFIQVFPANKWIVIDKISPFCLPSELMDLGVISKGY